MDGKRVFVSYAHVDDARFGDRPIGWVSLFVRHLESAAHMQAGGKQVRLPTAYDDPDADAPLLAAELRDGVEGL